MKHSISRSISKVERLKAKRLEENLGLRDKAPVAAQFEDCWQEFERLSSSLQANQSNSELNNISKDCKLRLKVWGDDSGASSRSLDYALRSSPVVRRQTQRLLQDLHDALGQGTLKGQYRTRFSLTIYVCSHFRGPTTGPW